LSFADLAEMLQGRIHSDLNVETVDHTPRNRPDPDKRRSVGTLEVQIAKLEEAVATAAVLGEQRLQEAETAAKRVEVLEGQIAALEEVVAKAETVSEQRRREAHAVAKQAGNLIVELIEITSVLVEMSKRIAEQTAATDKVRAEFDYYR
jgi:hypothetical protein